MLDQQSEQDRKTVLGDYVETMGRLAAQLEASPRAFSPCDAISVAGSILLNSVTRGIKEAAQRLRDAKGLPGPAHAPVQDDEELSHGERGHREGDRVLRFHTGVNEEPDIEDLTYLLRDLMHWCGDDTFGVALDEARDQYEDECGEDNADAALADAPPEEQRLKQRQLHILRNHQPARYDA